MKFLTLITLFSTGLALTACATGSLYTTPESTDFSGSWILDEENSDTVFLRPDFKKAKGGNGRRPPNSGRGAQANRKPGAGNKPANSPQLTPAMVARAMTIEMDETSMGISYPKDTYRDVDWGKREVRNTEIDAGWQENQLVIKTKSSRGTLVETYELVDNGQRLLQTISIKGARFSRDYQRQFLLETEDDSAAEEQST